MKPIRAIHVAEATESPQLFLNSPTIVPGLADGIHFAHCRYDYSNATLCKLMRYSHLPDTLKAAVSARQIDFLAGRICATHALRAAGLEAPRNISIGTDGAPNWPSEYVGSISHCDGWAISLVSSKAFVLGIGVDIERELTSDSLSSITKYVSGSNEVRLGAQANLTLEGWLTIIFSAKESLFKALYPDVGRYFDFLDATVDSLEPSTGRLTLRLVRDLSDRHNQGSTYPIEYGWLGSRVVTSCILKPSSDTVDP